MSVRELIFRSEDRRFGLRVPPAEIGRLLGICRGAYPKETGGILVGVYNQSLDCAQVQTVTGPGNDARAGRTWFERGVAGLQEILRTHWQERRGYYLGEWHFHPGTAPVPSPTDERSMPRFAASARYRCPEPVLLIVGGHPDATWTASATVYPRNLKAVRLNATSV